MEIDLTVNHCFFNYCHEFFFEDHLCYHVRGNSIFSADYKLRKYFSFGLLFTEETQKSDNRNQVLFIRQGLISLRGVYIVFVGQCCNFHLLRYVLGTLYLQAHLG